MMCLGLGYGHVVKSDFRKKKTLQKMLKLFDCRKSIRKQTRPSLKKIVQLHFVLFWFRENCEFYFNRPQSPFGRPSGFFYCLYPYQMATAAQNLKTLFWKR